MLYEVITQGAAVLFQLRPGGTPLCLQPDACQRHGDPINIGKLFAFSYPRWEKEEKMTDTTLTNTGFYSESYNFV